MTDLHKAAQQALEYLGAPSAKLWPAGTQYRIIAALHAALAQQAEPKGGGRLPPPLQAEPVAWRCACGANLYIDADGAPRSKAEPVQEPVAYQEDIIRMAREAASEDGSIDRKDGKNVVLYAAKTSRFLERIAALVAAAEREAIMDEWSACVQSDLENGVRWLNEQAAKKWQESYPAMAGFADKIYARGETK
jgi:hypothetical protein